MGADVGLLPLVLSIIFVPVDSGVLLMPPLHKPANRYAKAILAHHNLDSI